MITNEASGVYSTIIDNSVYTDDTGNRTIMALFPIFSSRGPDNRIVTFGSIDTSKNIEKVYGKPVFSKYGQLYHNAMQWAEQNYDTAICRLMPSDATYANISFVYSKTKTELTTVSATGAPFNSGKTIKVTAGDKFKEGMIVDIGDAKFTVEKIQFTAGDTGEATLTFKEDIATSIQANTQIFLKEKKIITKPIASATADSVFETKLTEKATYTQEVLEKTFMVVRAIGRGIDYNKLSLAINSYDLDENQDFITYNFKLYDKSSERGLDYQRMDDEFDFSFDPDAEDVNGMNLYIGETSSLYSKTVSILINNVELKKIICDMFDLDFATATERDIYRNDIFKGDLNFSDFNKNRFGEGSDGSLWDKNKELNWGETSDWEGTDLTNGVNLIRALLNGTFDKQINNTNWYPIKYIFDANLPLPAKIALADFAHANKYTRAIIDTGFITDPSAECNWRKNKFKFDSHKVAIYPNHGYTIDKYTGKKIKVTSTYNVVKLYAKIKNTLGFHYAIGGYNSKGLMDEMIDVVYSPILNERNELYKNQFNTIDKVPEGIYIVENITATKTTSALQQNHISDTVQDVEYKLTQYCKKYILNMRITNSTLKEAQSEISVFLSQYVESGACEYITVNVSATDLQRAKQQFYVKVGAKFASIARQVFIELSVEGEGSRSN